MNYFCCDEFRRNDVKHHPTLNGIDFLEVVDNPLDPYDVRQTLLKVHFLKPLNTPFPDKTNVIIEGGERIENIRVVNVYVDTITSPPDTDADKILLVKVKEAGDFSKYTLRIVVDANHKEPPAGFDPVLSSVVFSFKALCFSDFDCKTSYDCVTENKKAPDINYLAKDYSSFRQLIFDRLAVIIPQWRERNTADLGVMLVELLAYAGDYLSYQQDAIATEAYLGTSRKRISVRRHARLVDYYIHDGSNARTWMHIEVKDSIAGLILEEKTKFLTKCIGLPPAFRSDSDSFTKAKEQDVHVFETLHPITLDTRHNAIQFYTWKQSRCCLPKGSVAATLDGDLPGLKPGDVLIFTEIRGPQTGKEQDADLSHCHPVCITGISSSFDPLGDPLSSPPGSISRPVTEITWHEDDALPFSLCISSIDENGESVTVSVAYGNNVLADHGETTSYVLEPVPQPDSQRTSTLSIIKPSTSACDERELVQLPLRYHPKLKDKLLTHAAGYQQDQSAFSSRQWQKSDVSPCISLIAKDETGDWKPLRDLLGCSHNDKYFVVETETDGSAYLRFGNDIQGQRPAPGTVFTATYRVGNGKDGNIGSKSLVHLVSDNSSITGANDIIINVWNPLPAIGGEEQESIEKVRQNAPISFQVQERAVTMPDYEELSTKSNLKIQRSAASLRWTGSWRTVFLTVDRLNGKKVDEKFETGLRNYIEKYRMAGQDIEVDDPQFVSLEIEMVVCVKRNYFAADVKAALLKVFSNQRFANGNTGVFHPDKFSFGQPVYLSRLYAAAQLVEGVDSVKITKFQRQGNNNNEALDSGKLLVNRLEIARLDNDPNFPEHGVFNLLMQGKK